MEIKNYERYRWFFTSSGKLVIGGKDVEQNEELVRKFMKAKKPGIVMHTKKPSSPFCFILDDKITKKDLEETAVFCACFSQQWRAGKKAVVDSFLSSNMYKGRAMEQGTFSIKKKQDSYNVDLRLYLTKQKGKLRAVPFKTGDIILMPGNIKKPEAVLKIKKKLSKKGIKSNEQEIEQAIPAGGFSING